MPEKGFLIDTNILIYHTQGEPRATEFIGKRISLHSFNISILTKIEFLGWDKHSPQGLEKCKRLLEIANVILLDDEIAEKAIEIRKHGKVKLADAVIAATALLHDLQLVTRNAEDFKQVKSLKILNPLA